MRSGYNFLVVGDTIKPLSAAAAAALSAQNPPGSLPRLLRFSTHLYSSAPLPLYLYSSILLPLYTYLSLRLSS
jgi:hypothetical protein